MSRTAHFVSPRSIELQHRSTLLAMVREMEASEGVVISSMPRGGLQIVQPQRVNEALVKAYARQFHADDQPSWSAIAHNRPAASTPGSAYVRFLGDFGFAHAASVRVPDPVFDGYAGVIQLFRTAEQGPFSQADLERLAELAAEVELPAAAGRTRHSPRGGDPADAAWRKRPDCRQWVIQTTQRDLGIDCSFQQLDPQVREHLIEEAHKLAKTLTGELPVTHRLALPDTEGDFWTFNLVGFARYPALADGPVVFACLQPDFPEWVHIRSADFQADPELARLVPALKFMQQEFRRGPTLGEIAQTVHLSPFHFHRRFSELLGLTPKHFLLECQIHEAKHELLAGNKSLAKIAADCGFAHQSHFTSRFKQTTGLTPTRWRRMARNRAQSIQD